MEKDYLINALDKGMSTRGIARDSGKSQTTVRYWLKKYCLVSSGKKRIRACSCGKEISFYAKSCLECHHRQRSIIQDALFLDWVGGNNSVLTKSEVASGSLSLGRKKRLFSHVGNRCEQCGWSVYAAGYDYPALEISHDDNDFTNMSFSNITVLCPNCHTIKTLEEPVKSGNGRRVKYENAPVA